MTTDTDLSSNDPVEAARPPAYRSYLLRLWEERSEQPAMSVWRFSLEDPLTAQRQGFASLEALTHWLESALDELGQSKSLGNGYSA